MTHLTLHKLLKGDITHQRIA